VNTPLLFWLTVRLCCNEIVPLFTRPALTTMFRASPPLPLAMIVPSAALVNVPDEMVSVALYSVAAFRAQGDSAVVGKRPGNRQRGIAAFVIQLQDGTRSLAEGPVDRTAGGVLNQQRPLVYQRRVDRAAESVSVLPDALVSVPGPLIVELLIFNVVAALDRPASRFTVSFDRFQCPAAGKHPASADAQRAAHGQRLARPQR